MEEDADYEALNHDEVAKDAIEVPSEDDVPEHLRTRPDGSFRFVLSWRKLWAFCGPGWLMSLAYLDPGNLEADLQQGAYTRFRLVWVLWWATVMGLVLQEMSARLGVVTGKSLSETARERYPRWVSNAVYVNMEVAVIGSDIQEGVGSAIAINLLFPRVPLWAGCLITGLDTFTFMAVHFLGARYLEALITTLVGAMAVCFFVNWGEVDTPPGPALAGWAAPTMKRYMVMQAVGTIGAVIMPHNLYLHSGLVQSRKLDRGDDYRVFEARARERSPRTFLPPSASRARALSLTAAAKPALSPPSFPPSRRRARALEATVYNALESAGALAVSFVINLAVVATFAGSFYSARCAPDGNACMPTSAVDDDDWARDPDYCTADERADAAYESVCAPIGLAQAGPALEKAFGGSGLLIWAVGLLAAGQASTMTATFAGQIIMSGFVRLDISPCARRAPSDAL